LELGDEATYIGGILQCFGVVEESEVIGGE